MKTHRQKIREVIIVTVLLVLYYAVYFGSLIFFLDGVWKVVLGIIPMIFGVGMIAVCVERIKEIKRGEEDDLSKY